MEQALAIMDAASSLDAPVIIQASRGARSYANDVDAQAHDGCDYRIYPQIPVCVHLDHGNEPATCMTAIQAGFTSVMMDGSLKADGKTPGDWDYNVGSPGKSPTWPISAAFRGGRTWRAGFARDRHGRQGGRSRCEGKLSTTSCSPIPTKAVKFVKETKVDALAIAMGTSHGAYKFTRKPDGDILA